VSRPEDEVIRARQRKSAKVTAWLLFAFIALTFFITIAKMTVNQ
jgi:hypothetical protein